MQSWVMCLKNMSVLHGKKYRILPLALRGWWSIFQPNRNWRGFNSC